MFPNILSLIPRRPSPGRAV